MSNEIHADMGTADLATQSIAPAGKGAAGKGAAGKGSGTSDKSADNESARKKRKPNDVAKLNSKQRSSLSDSDFAYVDSKGGEHLPIHDAAHARNALARFNQTHFESAEAKEQARRKIRAAAKKFGVQVSNEDSDLRGILCLEFSYSQANVPPKPEDQDDGVMRLRVPFYIGNSVARPSGWTEPLFFAAEELPGILASAKEQIRLGQLPLTVYARHSHATTGDYLPIGRVYDVEAEGEKGYAYIEVANDGDFGTRVQKLVQARMLNSVSLRSQRGVTLEERKVNGEVMAAPVGMKLAGIDFAPEGPAMATYGIDVLAEARVEPYNEEPLDEEEPETMEITLEAVQARADIVSTLTKPHTDKVAALEADLKTQREAGDADKRRIVELEAAVAKAEVEGAIDEMAGRFPKPKKARKVLAEVCKNAKSKADVYLAATPVLLDTVESFRAVEDKTEKTGDNGDNDGNKTQKPSELLAELWGRPSGSGSNDDSVNKSRVRNDGVEYAGDLPLPA